MAFGAPKRFRWSGDWTGALHTTCLGCGEEFDGRHSEVKSWEAFHLATCDKPPLPAGAARARRPGESSG